MSQAVKVGIFVTLCLVVLGYLIFQVEDLNPFGAEGRRVDVVFDSVAGLNEKSAVRVAGVRVGTVESMGLDGNRARVTLLLDESLDLSQGATAAIISSGLLGDKYIELSPGPAGAPALAADTVLEGATPITFDKALERFDSLGKSLQELSGDVSTRGDLGGSIRRLLDNLEATSADIRELVATNRGQVNSTLANFERFSVTLAQELPRLSQQMTTLLGSIDTLVAENREDLSGSLENLRGITEKMQVSVDNLNGITGQIQSGEGTLGKLVYDDDAHTSLVSALDSVESGVKGLSDTLDRVKKLELDLALEGTAFTDIEDGSAAFRLRLANHPHRFYSVGLVDTPQGKVSEETRTLTTTFPDGSTETTVIREEKVEGDFTITAQLGYNFGPFDLRAGLIESSGGAGLDYHLFERRLTFSLEAFDFSRAGDLDPHLRFTTRFKLHPNVYLIGGYDDPLVDEFDSLFVGAGIRWKDDDLKYLLGSVGRF